MRDRKHSDRDGGIGAVDEAGVRGGGIALDTQSIQRAFSGSCLRVVGETTRGDLRDI